MCSLNARSEGQSGYSPESEVEEIRYRAVGLILGSLIDTCSKVHDNARMKPGDSNDLPFFERPDLSPFLVHLTRNTTATDDYSAYDNLVSILMTGEIFASTGTTGFIKGTGRASCFMDIPLGSLKYVLNEANTNPRKPRYEPFGIVVTNEYAYARGCRPVLYLSDDEIKSLAIPKRELWRVVRLDAVDGTGVNWLHEREWRAKGSFPVPGKVRAVLVNNTKSAQHLQKQISNEPSSFKSLPAAIIPLTILCQGLPYLHSEA